MKRNIINSFNVLLLIYCFSCASAKYSVSDLQGTFFQDGNKNAKIIIDGNSFISIEQAKESDLANPCCDTIAIGSFDIDKRGFLVINSPTWLNDIFVDISVNERKGPVKDTIIFIISNPIETALKKGGSKRSELEYSLLVQPKSGSLDYFNENNQIFDHTRFSYYNPRHLPVQSFMVTIKPKPSIFLKNLARRELSSLEYHVKDQDSNIFEISIPELSYGYLSYKRMNGEFAKIVDSNTIVWDGKQFARSRK